MGKLRSCSWLCETGFLRAQRLFTSTPCEVRVQSQTLRRGPMGAGQPPMFAALRWAPALRRHLLPRVHMAIPRTRGSPLACWWGLPGRLGDGGEGLEAALGASHGHGLAGAGPQTLRTRGLAPAPSARRSVSHPLWLLRQAALAFLPLWQRRRDQHGSLRGGRRQGFIGRLFFTFALSGRCF